MGAPAAGAAGTTAAGATEATGGMAGFMSKATPLIGLGLGAINIASDLEQAGAAADAASAAERAAELAAKKQEQIQGQNFMEKMQLPMEEYNRERAAVTASGKQILEAGVEGDARQLQGLAGRIQAGTVGAQAGITDRAADELYKLNMAKAVEAGATADEMAKLQAERLKGAQSAAASSRAAQLAALTGVGQAATGMINTGLGMISPFGEKEAAPGEPAPTGLAKAQQEGADNPYSIWNASQSTQPSITDKNALPLFLPTSSAKMSSIYDRYPGLTK